MALFRTWDNDHLYEPAILSILGVLLLMISAGDIAKAERRCGQRLKKGLPEFSGSPLSL